MRKTQMLLIICLVLALPLILSTSVNACLTPFYVPASSFYWGSGWPPAPTYLGSNTWKIPEPVAPNSGMLTSDVIGKTFYKTNAYGFNAQFVSNGGAHDIWSDEYAIFATNDTAKWTGFEFGIRMSLADNIVRFYTQYVDINKQPHFDQLTLFTNDGRTHSFTLTIVSDSLIRVTVDKSTFNYSHPKATFLSNTYTFVATAHRTSGGWDELPDYFVFAHPWCALSDLPKWRFWLW